MRTFKVEIAWDEIPRQVVITYINQSFLSRDFLQKYPKFLAAKHSIIYVIFFESENDVYNLDKKQRWYQSNI